MAKAVGGKGATAKEISNPKRVASDAKAETIKLEMSEALSLFAVLQHWVRQTVVPSGSHAEATESMLALLDFIELLYYQAPVEVTPAELTAASTRFLRLANQAFGTEWMIPKAHLQLHIGKCMEGCFFAFSHTDWAQTQDSHAVRRRNPRHTIGCARWQCPSRGAESTAPTFGECGVARYR
ncbi:hypothetical protein N9L68_02800 [bacterium]|nr:hypothetical protein [bacterium]